MGRRIELVAFFHLVNDSNREKLAELNLSRSNVPPLMTTPSSPNLARISASTRAFLPLYTGIVALSRTPLLLVLVSILLV